jgi:hypothetical protein
MKKIFSLSVGINDYPGTNADLRGCVNDAGDWHALLKSRGAIAGKLLDEAATKVAVVSNLEWMVGESRFGDTIVFTYSGHGSWIADTDGDEPDRRDEVLVLHDFARGGLLSDDEMHRIFQRRRHSVRVIVISDSCHSGTLHRFVSLEGNAFGVPRFLPPANFLEGEALTRAAVVEERAAKTRPRPATALLSGCADAEYSYDAFFDRRPQGAFTHAALRTYATGQSLATWHKRIREVLPSGAYPQTPQLAATSSQRRWKL